MREEHNNLNRLNREMQEELLEHAWHHKHGSSPISFYIVPGVPLLEPIPVRRLLASLEQEQEQEIVEDEHGQ